jgi:iron-sulfur cluster assembly protein
MAQPSKLKIDISDNAMLKIQALASQQAEQDKNGPEGQGLRVKVVGGGCSGLSYKMNLDAQRDGDRVFERGDVKVLVDRKSFLYLRGTELDYSESLMDSGFKLNNPNVKRSCGCGSSFSV